MSDIIFVKPRHDYGSMRDYWQLVELAGYRWCYEDQVNLYDPDICYILTWFSAQLPYPADTRARLICWNLEWADNPTLPGVEYWSPDKWYAEQHGWQYVPVGSHRLLRFASLTDEHDAKLYDVTLQMYRDVSRRASLIKRIHDAGITIAPDGWDETRHQALVHSRCQVHIHQHDHTHAVSPLRFAVAAAYRLPVITERLNDAGVFARAVIQSTYDGLPDCVQEYLKPARREALYEYGAALHERLCVELTFKRVIESSV